jgi:hypothetical protein
MNRPLLVRRAAIPVETAVIEHTDAPVRLRIADRAEHVRELGVSDRAIARALESATRRSLKPPARPGALARERPNPSKSCD